MKRASSPSTDVARAPKSKVPNHLPSLALRPISTESVGNGSVGGSCANADDASARNAAAMNDV